MTTSPPPSSRFELVKWYLDAVEADGSASIAYWASIAWLGVHVHWHDVTRYPLHDPLVEHSSLRRVPPPQFEGGHVAWRSAPLGFVTDHQATAAPVTLVLLDDASGRITWECLAPSARTRFVGDGATRIGTGYAERLTMTVPPSALPMDGLRWGRWVSDDAASSLAWIDWLGAAPRRWILRNGTLQQPASVQEHGIDTPAGQLVLGTPRTLLDRPLGALFHGLSGPARIAAHIPVAWEEHKWCSRAEWTDASGRRAPGWAIHELVRFG